MWKGSWVYYVGDDITPHSLKDDVKICKISCDDDIFEIDFQHFPNVVEFDDIDFSVLGNYDIFIQAEIDFDKYKMIGLADAYASAKIGDMQQVNINLHDINKLTCSKLCKLLLDEYIDKLTAIRKS